MPYSSSAGQESVHSSLSRGTDNKRAYTESATLSLGDTGASSFASTLRSEHHQGLVASQRPSTDATAKTLSSARVAPPNGSTACRIPYTTSAQQVASLTSFLQPAYPQPTGYRYALSASSSSTGHDLHDHVSNTHTASWTGGLQAQSCPSAAQPNSKLQQSQPTTRLPHAGYPAFNSDRPQSEGYIYQNMVNQAQHQYGSQFACSQIAPAPAVGNGSAQAMQGHPSRLAQTDHPLFKPAPLRVTSHNQHAIWNASWQHASQQTLAAGRQASADGEASAAEEHVSYPAPAAQHCSLIEYFKPDEALPQVQSHSHWQPSSMLGHRPVGNAVSHSDSIVLQPSKQPALQLGFQQRRHEHCQNQVLSGKVTAPIPQRMSRAKESPAYRAVLQQPGTAKHPLRPGLLDLPTVERVRCPRANMRRYVPNELLCRY